MSREKQKTQGETKMQNKEKQIEEMASILMDHCNCAATDCSLIADCDICRAEILYNAGYRKIQTTNWLTKGISEEQLEREKDEALKEFFERNCEKYGYRKQSVGEWVAKNPMIRSPFARNYYCSVCKYEPIETKSFCPECGAKMKGGAE